MGETLTVYPNLNDQRQFGLNKINEVKDYFLLLKFMKENYCIKGLVNILLLSNISINL